METYRYRIVQREEPQDEWTLYASFATKRDANRELKILRANSAWFQTFKVVDGKETTIERPLY